MGYDWKTGFLGDLFKSDIKQLPDPTILETPWGPEVRSFLQNIMRGKGVGMTEAEKEGMTILMNILEGGAFQDPRTSPLYAGLRRESMREEERGASELRRFSQLGGMLRSQPAMKAEGQYRARMAGQRGTLLGGLYETERARDNPYTRLMAARTYGGLPRQIEAQQSELAKFLLGYQPFYQKKYRQIPSTFSQIAGPLGQIMQGLGQAGAFA